MRRASATLPMRMAPCRSPRTASAPRPVISASTRPVRLVRTTCTLSVDIGLTPGTRSFSQAPGGQASRRLDWTGLDWIGRQAHVTDQGLLERVERMESLYPIDKLADRYAIAA